MSKRPKPHQEDIDIKRPTGRPRFEPTTEQRALVQIMVGTLVPQATIARNIGGGIALNTLKEHFSDELEHGREQVVATLKARMYRASENGSVRATSWLLERLGGPEFAPRLRLGGMDDAPAIQVSSESRVTVYIPDNGRGDRKPDET